VLFALVYELQLYRGAHVAQVTVIKTGYSKTAV